MSHNTNVTNVSPPYGLSSLYILNGTGNALTALGGYPKFIQNGYNDHHLALWMQKESDYNTYYVGKLFNAHNAENYNKPHMSGYTGFEFFLEPYTYQVCELLVSPNTQLTVKSTSTSAPRTMAKSHISQRGIRRIWSPSMELDSWMRRSITPRSHSS